MCPQVRLFRTWVLLLPISHFQIPIAHLRPFPCTILGKSFPIPFHSRYLGKPHIRRRTSILFSVRDLRKLPSVPALVHRLHVSLPQATWPDASLPTEPLTSSRDLQTSGSGSPRHFRACCHAEPVLCRGGGAYRSPSSGCKRTARLPAQDSTVVIGNSAALKILAFLPPMESIACCFSEATATFDLRSGMLTLHRNNAIILSE